ncbi:MAG: hypothetical protein FJ271_07205 [Planctomycetes bacterium]|nr:hypothetical protein [Planctomycetota bacterium]
MKSKSKADGNGKLEEAMAMLIQNQAAFIGRLSEMDRINAERFGRIESTLIEHSHVLAEHGRVLAEVLRMLQALPDTIREKIGFKPPTNS